MTQTVDTKWTPPAAGKHRMSDRELTLTTDTKWTSYSAVSPPWDDGSSCLKQLINMHNAATYAYVHNNEHFRVVRFSGAIKANIKK